jgi:hypothetical protein
VWAKAGVKPRIEALHGSDMAILIAAGILFRAIFGAARAAEDNEGVLDAEAVFLYGPAGGVAKPIDAARHPSTT